MEYGFKEWYCDDRIWGHSFLVPSLVTGETAVHIVSKISLETALGVLKELVYRIWLIVKLVFAIAGTLLLTLPGMLVKGIATPFCLPASTPTPPPPKTPYIPTRRIADTGEREASVRRPPRPQPPDSKGAQPAPPGVPRREEHKATHPPSKSLFREDGEHIIRVEGDGNCAYYCFLLGLYVKEARGENPMRQTTAQVQARVALERAETARWIEEHLATDRELEKALFQSVYDFVDAECTKMDQEEASAKFVREIQPPAPQRVAAFKAASELLAPRIKHDHKAADYLSLKGDALAPILKEYLAAIKVRAFASSGEIYALAKRHQVAIQIKSNGTVQETFGEGRPITFLLSAKHYDFSRE